ncbi:MAG: N-acetylmuramoyl-L-alanine amidase [Alkaliphilus sp.]
MFRDTLGHWAEKKIEKIANFGLMTGYEDGTFRPNTNVTRAELATVLSRLTMSENEKTRICIDPGHGGSDRSNRGFSGEYVEADGMLTLSQHLRDELIEHRFIVKLTRETDKTLGLRERAKIAYEFAADLFISLHSNAGGGRGVEVFYSVDLPQNRALAGEMSKSIANVFRSRNRGAKTKESNRHLGEDFFAVIDEAEDLGIPNILLVENLFHDNVHEEKILLNNENLKKIAKAQAGVIIDFFNEK